MALDLSPETESLATEVAQAMGVSVDEAIQRALDDQKRTVRDKQIDDGMRWLREKLWPNLPPGVRGKAIPKEDWDALNDEGSV